MPAFTAIGAYVAGTILGLAGTAAIVVGAIVATGAAYVTSRIINGNPNKGNNSAANQGGRIQVPPATNNKIPVVYGSAYVNGIITDARLKSLGGTTNDTMYYCIVLSEYTNNLTTPSYALESVLWNDLRLTPVDATANAHKVKDGRKVVDGAIINAGSFVVGKTYVITKKGTTDFTAIGSQTNNIGQIFAATGVGSGTGQAQEEDFIDTNFIVDGKSLVELRVYAGSSAASSQIYPAQSTGNTQAAYDFWGNDDNSWTTDYQMKGLVFAIVKLTYAGNQGFTGLPNVTFQLANNISNPADVWYDYMTSERYGAGIPAEYIDTTARTDWYNFCEEDITYTNVAGETNQTTLRYNINGVIDTSNQVKTNIDTILQNGGAWMSYNVSTGLWSPIIKKAVSAGTATESATLFTASRTGSTLTVTNFPSGRIEPGQLLYNSTGTLIGTVSAQLFPLTAGETTGQKGRYTISTSGTISSTTFYTLPATTLAFNDDNIISGISISSTRLEDLYNQVEAEFYNRYNKDQRAYARVDLDSAARNPNEPDNELRLSLDLVNNSIQADLLGQLEMRQSRDDLVIEFTSNHYGIQAQAGDVIAVTSDLYSWYPKYFRVMRVKEIENEDASLTAQIQALEYNPDVYTVEPITEFSTSANIGIGNLVSSVGLPAPTNPVITNPNPDDSVPNFTFSVDIPSTGGPFDEIEIYYTEGWDPFNITGSIVVGTGSNGAPVGKGLLTVSSATYDAINQGDYLSISTSGDVVVDSQVLPLITGEVLKGKGRYIVTVANLASLPLSGTTLLYDKPLDVDFKYLKRVVPQGNASSFTSGSTVSVVITELPANSATYRRYFLKARLGWKKNFGAFTSNYTVDLDGNVKWNPNPTAAGKLSDLSDVSITSINEGQTLYYDATTSKWKNNSILEVDDATTRGGIVVGQGLTQPMITFNAQAQGVNAMYGIRGMSAQDDPWFVGAGSTGIDSGYLEIATGDNAGDPNGVASPIYARQYNGYAGTGAPWYGGNGTVVNELTLLDGNGNTIIPKNLQVGSFANQIRATPNNTITPTGIGAVIADNDYWFLGGYNTSGFISTGSSISGTTLTIGTLTAGTIATGQTISGGTVTAGTTITANISGSGSGSTWTVSTSQTVSSSAISGQGTNAGAMVIASGNNGNEPIYVRQMTGPGNPTTTDFPQAVGINTITNQLTLLDASGNTIVPNDLAVNGGDITTTQTTASLYNTTATTVNIGGAATKTNIGLTLPSNGDFPGGGSILIDDTLSPKAITLLGELKFTQEQVGSGAPYYDGPFPTLEVMSSDSSDSINLFPTSNLIYFGARAGEVRIGNLDDSGYTYIAGDRLEVAGPSGLKVTANTIYGSGGLGANIFATSTGNIEIGSYSGSNLTNINTVNTNINNLKVAVTAKMDTVESITTAANVSLYETTTGNIGIGATGGTTQTTNINTTRVDVNRLRFRGVGAARTSIIASGATVDTTYTLPTSLPASNGQVLASTTGGVMSWTSSTATPAGSNTQIQFNNSGAFAGSSSLTWDGTTLKATNLESTNSSGDEGGEIRLNKATTNTTLTTGVTIDVYQNKLRFFETGGSNRGAFIDLTSTGNSAGTNLLTPSSTPVTYSGNQLASGFAWSLGPGVIFTSAGSSAAFPLSSLRYQPLYVTETCSLTDVAITVSGTVPAGIPKVMISIMNCNPDSASQTGWQPISLNTYLGELTISTTGLKTISLSGVTLNPGAYLIVLQSNNFGTGTFTLGHYGGQVLIGNGYTINATTPTTAYSWGVNGGVSYTTGSPVIQNFTQLSTPAAVGMTYTVFTKFTKV